MYVFYILVNILHWFLVIILALIMIIIVFGIINTICVQVCSYGISIILRITGSIIKFKLLGPKKNYDKEFRMASDILKCVNVSLAILNSLS